MTLPHRLAQRFCTLGLVTVTAVALTAAAHAQTPPDAGTLQQQIDRERQLPLPRPPAPEKTVTPPDMKPPGAALTVKQFRFIGNRLIPSETLAAVVAGYRDRPLSFGELQAAAAAVAEHYRAAGWVVRAYLPQQDIVDGIVTIQIVEAVFGGVRPAGEPPLRLKLSTALSMFAAQQPEGAPVNSDAIDRALLLTDDLPGITAAGNLVAGDHAGETDLVLKLADEPLLIGDAGSDNGGSRSTGATRLTLDLSLNSPLALGDQLTAQAIHTQGSDYLRLAYSLPVGHDGWRVGMNVSHLRYELVAAEFKAMNADGSSDSVGLDVRYPIIRSRLRNLYFTGAIDRRRFDNRSGGAVTTRYTSDSLTLGLSGNLFDRFGGGGANSAGIALTSGELDLDGSPNRAADAATTRSHGGFSKLRYTLSRQQAINEDLSLFAAWSGQSANKNLDSSEKFYLGGRYGVRAYPANEGGGSNGQLLNLELRWRLPHGLTATAFHDWGQVRQNVDNYFAGAPALDTYRLRGHGLALGWLGPLGVNMHLTWATRGGSNPNADPVTGHDQDGSDDKHRWWLSARLPF